MSALGAAAHSVRRSLATRTRTRQARGGRPRRARQASLKVFIGLLILVWSLAPVYWGIVVSLSTPLGLNAAHPSYIPHPATLSNYSAILSGPQSSSFLPALRNSIIEAGATTVVTVIIALLAAYAFARWRFRFSSALFLVILGTLSLPVYAVIIPVFQFASDLQQVDTYQVIVLINMSASLPLAVWILRSHIASLPADIEHAAALDGARPVTILRKIVAPLIGPGVAAASVITFLTTWAAFLIPLTLASTAQTEPLTVIIPQYTTRYSQEYGVQAAAGMLALVPPIIVVIWLNRYLLKGLLTGALNK